MLTFLSSLTLQAKLVIAGIFLVLFGYTYYWTFSKGEAVGSAITQEAAFKAFEAAMVENGIKAKQLREKELQEARATADNMDKKRARKINDLQKANEILQEAANKQFAAIPVPDDIVGLLNNSRSGPST